MAQFGEILAELRKDHNMSQKELAKIIYVSTGTILRTPGQNYTLTVGNPTP